MNPFLSRILRPARRGYARAGLVFGLILASAALLLTAPRAAPEPPPAAGQVARLLVNRLPERHLSRRPLDEEMAAHAMDAFLSSVDFDRTAFLQADIDEFRARIPDLIPMLRNGDVSFAMEVFERLKERLANRVEFAERALAEGFDFDRTDTYRWRRREAPWPADPGDWDETWRRKLQHEVLARMIAVSLAAEDDGENEGAEPREAPEAGLPDENLPPGEFVLKRHRQYLLVLQDSDEEWILERFFSAFTRAYDPHSDYLSPARSEDFDINMRLSLVGIGAMLTTEDGAAKIERVIPGGPADLDGRLQPGDRIVAVGQGDEAPVDVLHWPLYRVVRLIRGERGTRVVLTVWPASDISGSTERRIDIVRDEVKLEERAASGEIRRSTDPRNGELRVGVLRLPDFYADFQGMRSQGEDARRSSRDVRRILEEFRRDGVDGVVFDLRNNGGGSLPDAIEIAGLFLGGGPLVQVRDERRVQIIMNPDPDIAYPGPLVVLVNRMSASASEIVAAALQDYRRAVIIGDRRTHGKGTVQTLLPLGRGDEPLGQLKVTTASFYRVAGGSTQLRGVEPDVVISSPFDALDVGEETLPRAMPWTQVRPAPFTPYADAIPPVEDLLARSEARRAQDPEFLRLAETVERIGQRIRTEDISLNLEERMRLARAERELDRVQRSLGSARFREDPEDGETPRDLALEEAVRILADMIALRQEPGPAAETVRAAGP